jgi:type I restriction enzyme M protein
LKEFVLCYCTEDRGQRKESANFRRFSYSDIQQKDKANLDISWGQGATNVSETATPQALMKDILKDLREAE